MTHEFEYPYAVGNVINIHLKTSVGLEATAGANIISLRAVHSFLCGPYLGGMLLFKIGSRYDFETL
ncbi:uncharacterized protein N7487_010509 [Penicillium crustosum]|uniref:uncharacterized protein n=1 Tax=Penicillium crustosum TaxID=36656 RepID=UPI0023867256|nr:uncharacterized protein N7487_010509 [Penicillium crustosum]KAJ5396206.1 hypothetical protein N7487_010509 [Penicillium crustosum]